MRPVPPAVRDSMNYARYIRDDSIAEWGRVIPFAREGIRLERKTTREILRAFRALRREEAAGLLGK